MEHLGLVDVVCVDLAAVDACGYAVVVLRADEEYLVCHKAGAVKGFLGEALYREPLPGRGRGLYLQSVALLELLHLAERVGDIYLSRAQLRRLVNEARLVVVEQLDLVLLPEKPGVDILVLAVEEVFHPHIEHLLRPPGGNVPVGIEPVFDIIGELSLSIGHYYIPHLVMVEGSVQRPVKIFRVAYRA